MTKLGAHRRQTPCSQPKERSDTSTCVACENTGFGGVNMLVCLRMVAVHAVLRHGTAQACAVCHLLTSVVIQWLCVNVFVVFLRQVVVALILSASTTDTIVYVGACFPWEIKAFMFVGQRFGGVSLNCMGICMLPR